MKCLVVKLLTYKHGLACLSEDFIIAQLLLQKITVEKGLQKKSRYHAKYSKKNSLCH